MSDNIDSDITSDNYASLFISEIFGPTIQGEGHCAGELCYFIRLEGCDQNPPCKWCDTLHAYICKEASRMYIPSIIKEIDRLKELDKNLLVNRFIITGGNPCMQNCAPLIRSLKRNYGAESYNSECIINIETQGTEFPLWLDSVNHVTVSPKPPSSSTTNTGQDITNLVKYCNRFAFMNDLEIKIVVFNNDDMKYALDVIYETSKDMNIHMDVDAVMYTLQLGTTMNNVDSVYTVDDMINTIRNDPRCSTDNMIKVFSGIRILPQIHNILKVR